MEKNFRLLIIPLILFLGCFLMAGYYNRFASDDFEFLNKLRQFGVLGSVQWFHEHWNTRWASIFILNTTLWVTLKSGTLIWYHLFSFGLLYWAFYRNINHISEIKNYAGLLAGFTSIAFFYASFSITDVFFWINTSTMYLLGCVAFLFALAEITTPKHTVASYLRLAGFGLFVAGAYEPLVFTGMVVCVVLLFFLVKKHGWNVWRIPFNKKVIIFLISLMLGFAISYSGDGHVVRAAYLPQTDFVFKFLVWIKAIIKIFVFYIPQLLLQVVLFVIPWFLAGMLKPLSWLTTSIIKIITVIFILLTVVSLLPVSFIMSEMGPERAWTQVSLYLVIYVSLLAVYSSRHIKKKLNMNVVLRVYATTVIIFIISNGISNVLLSKRYSDAYDTRIIQLVDEESGGNKNLILLEPLPPAGWLHSAEISTDSGYYNNRFLMEFLGLEFNIALKPEK